MKRICFLSKVAAWMSRGVAVLGKMMEEMICDRTHWMHSIKAGAWARGNPRQPLSPKNAIMNERTMMMRYKLFKEPARARELWRAGSFGTLKAKHRNFEQLTRKEIK